MIGLSRRFPVWTVLLCLSLTPIKAAAQAREDVPQGYEDAPRADARKPIAKPEAKPVAKPAAAPAKEDIPQGYEDAPRADAKKPVAKKAAKLAKKDAPQGYEDAPEADENAPAALGGVGAGAAAPNRLAIAGAENADDLKEDDPQVKQLVGQFGEQMQRMLDVELAFIRRACDLDQPQREAVAKAGRKCMASVLRQCAVAQVRMERGRGGVMIAEEDDATVGPRTMLREQLAKDVGNLLRPEQLERFRRESKARDASRKRAVVHGIIAQVDSTLTLSADQRDKLETALTEKYSKTWDEVFRQWMQNSHYVPGVLDAPIRPLLNDSQRTIWQRIPRVSFGNSMYDDFSMDSHITPIKDSREEVADEK